MAEEAPEDLTAVEAEVLPQTAEEKVRCQGIPIATSLGNQSSWRCPLLHTLSWLGAGSAAVVLGMGSSSFCITWSAECAPCADMLPFHHEQLMLRCGCCTGAVLPAGILCGWDGGPHAEAPGRRSFVPAVQAHRVLDQDQAVRRACSALLNCCGIASYFSSSGHAVGTGCWDALQDAYAACVHACKLHKRSPALDPNHITSYRCSDRKGLGHRDYCEGLRDSLDLVPIGAWYGNGRKAGWFSPFLLAAYDPETETYASVCRCMSGFTDAFYAEARVLPCRDGCGPRRAAHHSSSLVSTAELHFVRRGCIPSPCCKIKGLAGHCDSHQAQIRMRTVT